MHEKELLSFIRNLRTWWFYLLSFLVPLTIFFLLFQFSGQLIKQQMEDGSKTRYKVAWIAEGNNAAALKNKLDLHLQIALTEDYEELELMEAIQNDSLDAALVIAEDFDSALVKKQQGQITLHYKSNRAAARLIEDLIEDYRKEIGTKNLAELELSKALVEPIYVSERNYFSMSEMMDTLFDTLQRSIGSLLALVLLIFGCLSARYALRLLFWAPLEGGQLGLIARTAVPKSTIFRTKFFWISIFVWENMLLALLGFSLAINFDQEGAIQNLIIQFRELLPWTRIGLFAVLALPFAFLLSGFFAFLGFWLTKWQFLSSNLSFLLLLFGFLLMGILPSWGITGSLIPFFNQVPQAIHLIAGQSSMISLTLSSTSSIFVAFLFVYLAFMRFNTEGFLLKKG